MTGITIIGAGAFGTALAHVLGRAGRDVMLWARDPQAARRIAETRSNVRHLPGVDLPENVTVTGDSDAIRGPGPVLLAVPAQHLASVLTQLHDALEGRALVACCKGIDLERLTGPSAVIAALCPAATPAVLTGPGFAADLARDQPTALTLACRDADAGESLQRALSTPALRLYRSTDPLGAELGGALKNVVAIGAGLVIGADLGESARAALITRGYAEMLRLALALGARADTLAGLSGLGDLVLTATSPQSRNYRYGIALGQGTNFAADVTVEGAATAHAVTRIARSREIDMPIATMIAAILDGAISIPQATQALLTRPLKEE